MKKARALNALSLFGNLLILGALIYSIISLVGENFVARVRLYPLFAASLLGLFALINIPFNIVGIAKKKQLSAFAQVLKLTGVTASLVSSALCVLLLIANKTPLMESFGNFSFQSYEFWTVILIPALGLLTYLFFDEGRKVNVLLVIVAILPTTIYVLLYYLNLTAQFMTYNDVADWYSLSSNMLNIVLWFALIGVALLIAILLLLLNKMLAFFYFRKVEVDSKEEAEPVLEGKEVLEEDDQPHLVINEPTKEEEETEAKEEPVEEQLQEEEKPVEEVKEEPLEEVQEEEPVQEEAKTEEPLEEKKEEKKPVKKATATKKASVKKEEAKKPAPKKEEATKVYHLTKRKEDGMWAITFVGGQKAVKLFKTKKEAEEYLETLTKNQGATALIRNSKGAKAGKFASSIKSDEEKK